jgi:Concanavalin A-like lectin/glucanases superfamily
MPSIGAGIRIQNSGVHNWTQQQIMDLFGDKIALWTSKDDEKAGYYVNKIGVQEREIVTELGVAGVIQPGRAYKFDVAKTQMARTTPYAPASFKPANNPVSLYFKFKLITTTGSNTIGLSIAPTAGTYYVVLAKQIGAHLWTSTGDKILYTSYSYQDFADNVWHKLLVVINPAGLYELYIDGYLQNSLDISGETIPDVASQFHIGQNVGGQVAIRDVRLFNRAITTAADRNLLWNDKYLSGCVSWWMCEEKGTAPSTYVKDCVGSNDLTKYFFDSTSYISGAWSSLLNKFGYRDLDYCGSDLLGGFGAMSDASQWEPSWFAVENGWLYYKAWADSTKLCNATFASVAITDTLRISFDILDGVTPTLRFANQGKQIINNSAVYAVGHHVIEFSPAYACTGICVSGVMSGGEWKMDNLIVQKRTITGIIQPNMDRVIPINDINGLALVFSDEAKINLIKISESIVSLPDYEGNLFDACEEISVNDWFDANGIGNQIALSDISKYQTYRQYYNDEQLIIIKKDQMLNLEQDSILKSYLKLGLLDNIFYPVDVAIGLTEGTTAQIYATVQALIDGNPVFTSQQKTPVARVLNPALRYISMGWADFFHTDGPYTRPMATKYGFSNSHYVQITPASNDYLRDAGYVVKQYPSNRKPLRMIEEAGGFRGNHGFEHISMLTSMPTYDGRTTPSNDDFRVERADGLNEFGNDVDSTVDATITSTIRSSWLLLSDTLGAKAWKNLSDADCVALRKSLAVFSMPLDGQNHQQVLEAMDFLSNRYCGTTGVSVYDNYTTRTPNTADGNEPSINNRIVGGIFQGAATTQNHEIWERIFRIINCYMIEFEGKIKPLYFYETPGGTSNYLFYRIMNDYSAGGFTDKLHTKPASGASEYSSTITGQKRSFLDCLRSLGYKCTAACQGDGYGQAGFDSITRLEGQRAYKKNGIKKLDNIGDGYVESISAWTWTLTLAQQNTLLASADVPKALYDLSGQNFTTLLNNITQLTAWGLTPYTADDSSTIGDGISSYVLVLEALYQFCKRAGIEVISYEEAYILGATKQLPIGYNYFPNNELATTVKTILNAVNSILYPDGWNGGIVIVDDTGLGGVNVLHIASPGTIFIRQYAIKPGVFNLSFKAKGIGTLKIRKILNNDTYNSTSGATFTEINSIVINSPAGYTRYENVVSLPDAEMEVYSNPSTPNEVVYQNYMKGYGNKICGIQIELIIADGNYVKMGNCSLTE